MNRRLLLCAVAVVSSLPCFAEDPPKESATPTMSRYAAERRYNEIDDQSNTIQKEIASLAAHVQLLERAQKQITDTSLNPAAMTAAIQHLQSTFQVVDALPPTVTISGQHAAVTAMYSARGELWQPFGSIEAALERVRPILRFGNEAAASDPLIESIKAAEPTDKMTFADPTPALTKVANTIPFQGGGIRKGEIDPQAWAAARQEIKSLTPAAIEQSFNKFKQDRLAYVAGMLTRFKAEIDARTARRDELAKTLAELDKSLQEQKQQQGALDRSLVWAVYGMIAALTILFLSLKTFSSDVAGKVVENRSLVEVMSMAFMLLTIIILGTGGKIGQETLGTLLGTIAGYIFGRKLGETSQQQPQQQHPTPPPPPKKTETHAEEAPA